MPGETAAPGTGTGKTGSPVGSDRRHQLQRHRERGRRELEPRQLVTDTVGITSSDANATLPANAALVAGTQDLRA